MPGIIILPVKYYNITCFKNQFKYETKQKSIVFFNGIYTCVETMSYKSIPNIYYNKYIFKIAEYFRFYNTKY